MEEDIHMMDKIWRMEFLCSSRSHIWMHPTLKTNMPICRPESVWSDSNSIINHNVQYVVCLGFGYNLVYLWFIQQTNSVSKPRHGAIMSWLKIIILWVHYVKTDLPWEVHNVEVSRKEREGKDKQQEERIQL